MHRIFCAPSRYIQGEGFTARLAVEMAVLGLHGPVLVGSLAVAALAPVWAAGMSAAGWHHRARTFGGECTTLEIDALVVEAGSLGAIDGAGGGNCLAAARAAAVAVGLPFVSCPTVASTDAPTTALSVIYTAAGVAGGGQDHRGQHAPLRTGPREHRPRGRPRGAQRPHRLPGTRASLHGEKGAFGTLVQMVLDGTPAEEFATVVRFCRAVGLPVTLNQFGLPAATTADRDAIAMRATQAGETIHNLPRPVTAADVAAAIREADGRAAEIAGRK